MNEFFLDFYDRQSVALAFQTEKRFKTGKWASRNVWDIWHIPPRHWSRGYPLYFRIRVLFFASDQMPHVCALYKPEKTPSSCIRWNALHSIICVAVYLTVTALLFHVIAKNGSSYFRVSFIRHINVCFLNLKKHTAIRQQRVWHERKTKWIQQIPKIHIKWQGKQSIKMPTLSDVIKLQWTLFGGFVVIYRLVDVKKRMHKLANTFTV